VNYSKEYAMTVVQVSTAPSRAAYDAVVPLVDLAGSRPEGLIAHTAHELPDGSVQIIDVYESREALEAFGRTRMLPAFQSAGVMAQVEAQGTPTAYDAFDVVR
jgi:hypothetical protein